MAQPGPAGDTTQQDGVLQRSMLPRLNAEWKILTQTFSLKSGSSLTLTNEAHTRDTRNQRVCGYSAWSSQAGPLATCTHPTDTQADGETEAQGTRGTHSKSWQGTNTKCPPPHMVPASGSIHLGPPQAGLVLDWNSHCPRLGLVADWASKHREGSGPSWAPAMTSQKSAHWPQTETRQPSVGPRHGYPTKQPWPSDVHRVPVVL